MNSPTIAIDMGQKCKRCSKLGAANGGVCLECAAEIISQRGGYMSTEKLGAKTRIEILRQVTDHLNSYAGELDLAYIRHKDEKFAIDFKVKIERTGEDNKVITSISFRPEPDTKDEETGFVNEDQLDLGFRKDVDE